MPTVTDQSNIKKNERKKNRMREKMDIKDFVGKCI